MTTVPVRLSTWPTPLEPAPRLAAAIGLHPDDLWVKRDDLTSFAGGNKVRKLEHLVAEAEAGGATVLVLSGEADPARPGNFALEELFGARVVVVEPDTDVGTRVAAVADELRAAGEVPAVLPLGGSTPTGARGYLACAGELAEQLPDLDTVVVAVGSGGTMAGLVAGLGAERVLGVDTGAVGDPDVRVVELVTALGATVGELRLRRDQVGEGYGVLTAAGAAAMTTAARTQGLVLDPVYTAKALAGLVAAVADGSVRPGRRTVLLHTGGLPGLFGHPYAAQLAGGVLGRS